MHVQEHGPGFPILSDDDRLTFSLKRIKHLGGVGFDITDGLDLGGKADWPASWTEYRR